MSMYHEFRGGKGYTLLVDRIKNDINGNPKFSIKIYEKAQSGEYSFELTPVISSARKTKKSGYVLSAYENEYQLANRILEDVLKEIEKEERAAI